jgi:hypothetical protein
MRYAMSYMPLRVFVMALVGTLLPLVVIVGVTLHSGIRISDMTRDVTAIAAIHPLTGALSNLGILVWWTSASIWFFAAALHHALQSREVFRFALSSGLLSAYLAIDDLFLIHETLVPGYLGLSERVVYGVLAFAVAVYLLLFRRLILRADGLLLLLAFAFLAASVVVDAAPQRWLPRMGEWKYFIEDGMKWLGIAGWCGFSIVRCRADVLAALHGATRPRGP